MIQRRKHFKDDHPVDKNQREVLMSKPKISTLANVEIAAKFFRGLGDPTRLQILNLLLEGDKNVSELVELLGSPQGRVSSHLGCLKWCGYVVSYQQGRFTYYRIADDRVRQILELAASMITANASYILSCPVIDGTRQGITSPYRASEIKTRKDERYGR